jgi:hypothetical protein
MVSNVSGRNSPRRSGMDRRTLLRRSAALTGAGLFVGAPVARSAIRQLGEPDVVAGLIEAVDVDQRRVVLARAEGNGSTLVVSLTGDTFLWRGHECDLADFAVGDRVVAEGRQLDDGFEATLMASTLYLLKAHPLSFEGSVIKTDQGDVVVDADTKSPTPTGLRSTNLSDYRIGETLELLVRWQGKQEHPLVSEIARPT